MARYIDVEEAKSNLDLLINRITLGLWPTDESLKGEVQEAFDSELNRLKEFRDILRDCEKDSVDAVEVVRCKDCKFYHKQECELENPYKTKEIDFCSFGQKKEEARDNS